MGCKEPNREEPGSVSTNAGGLLELPAGILPPVEPSPDGRYIAYIGVLEDRPNSTALVVVGPLDGKPEVVLVTDVAGRDRFRGFHWLPDSTIVLSVVASLYTDLPRVGLAQCTVSGQLIRALSTEETGTPGPVVTSRETLGIGAWGSGGERPEGPGRWIAYWPPDATEAEVFWCQREGVLEILLAITEEGLWVLALGSSLGGMWEMILLDPETGSRELKAKIRVGDVLGHTGFSYAPATSLLADCLGDTGTNIWDLKTGPPTKVLR